MNYTAQLRHNQNKITTPFFKGNCLRLVPPIKGGIKGGCKNVTKKTTYCKLVTQRKGEKELRVFVLTLQLI